MYTNGFHDIRGLIGNTPLVKLHVLSRLYTTNIYAKLEWYNPGLSIKDRTALYMIEHALHNGNIQAGGTIVEASSGNTALGLALLAPLYNLRCVVFTKDKISQEKLDLLKQYADEVHVCPADISVEHPHSANSRAAAYARDHENTFFCNQYYNEANPLAHYTSTGPEIWQQCDQMNYFIVGVGTGGTISGVGKYLKQQKKDIRVIGIDAVGSLLTSYFYTRTLDLHLKKKYTIEGIGKSYIPSTLHTEYIDDMIQIDDATSIHAAHMVLDTERLCIGYSSGTAIAGVIKACKTYKLGLHDHIVTIFPDHGSRYMSKIYNPDRIQKHINT